MGELHPKLSSYLESIYYDPKHPGSFSGPKTLYKAVKGEGKRIISMGKVKKWLKSQETYTMHRKMVRKFKHNRVQVDHIDEQWDADLMDMQYYTKVNDGIRFVLIAIDIFSRYAWAVPLENKQATTVKKGFEDLLSKANGRTPQKIRTDPGGEFANRVMKKWFDDHGILHSVTHNEVQANYVERLIKTIKSRIVKYFQHMNTHKYVDHLDDFLQSYNHSYHSGINMRPARVNKSNELMLWQQQYVEPLLPKISKTKQTKVSKTKVSKTKASKTKTKKQFRFKVGDRVRISYLRNLFQREYDQKWTGEVFTIHKRWPREGIPVYELYDYGNDPVVGTFYEPELQAVTFDAEQPFKIEKVLKTRGRGANKEFFVKWLNWPSKYNSWIKDYVPL